MTSINTPLPAKRSAIVVQERKKPGKTLFTDWKRSGYIIRAKGFHLTTGQHNSSISHTKSPRTTVSENWDCILNARNPDLLGRSNYFGVCTASISDVVWFGTDPWRTLKSRHLFLFVLWSLLIFASHIYEFVKFGPVGSRL